MASVQVTYWRDIPVLVSAHDGSEQAAVPLSPRFQDLVDRVAMASGLTNSSAYLEAWQAVPAGERPGDARQAAAALAAELEAGFDELRRRCLGTVGEAPRDPRASGA